MQCQHSACKAAAPSTDLCFESDMIRVLRHPQPMEGIAHSGQHDLSAPHALPGFSVHEAGTTDPLPGQPSGPAGHLPLGLRLL